MNEWAYPFREAARAARRLAKAINNAALAFAAWSEGMTVEEVAKLNRRRAYHYRLSERNRLHPKRKPKGGR